MRGRSTVADATRSSCWESCHAPQENHRPGGGEVGVGSVGQAATVVVDARRASLHFGPQLPEIASGWRGAASVTMRSAPDRTGSHP